MDERVDENLVLRSMESNKHKHEHLPGYLVLLLFPPRSMLVSFSSGIAMVFIVIMKNYFNFSRIMTQFVSVSKN